MLSRGTVVQLETLVLFRGCGDVCMAEARKLHLTNTGNMDGVTIMHNKVRVIVRMA